jgi:hypothetical protein
MGVEGKGGGAEVDCSFWKLFIEFQNEIILVL